METTGRIIKQGILGLILGIVGFGVTDFIFTDSFGDLGQTEQFLKLMFSLVGTFSIYAIFAAVLVAAIMAFIPPSRRHFAGQR